MTRALTLVSIWLIASPAFAGYASCGDAYDDVGRDSPFGVQIYWNAKHGIEDAKIIYDDYRSHVI